MHEVMLKRGDTHAHTKFQPLHTYILHIISKKETQGQHNLLFHHTVVKGKVELFVYRKKFNL